MNTIEQAVWRSVGTGWRQLYGSMRALGVSIEAHEFSSETQLDWGASFHTDSLEICLNLEGRGEVEAGDATMRFGPGTVGFYLRALEPLRAVRTAREKHRFITIELSHAWLLRVLAGYEKGLTGFLRETLLGSPPRSGVGAARPMSVLHESIAAAMLHPPVGPAGRALWFEAKVLELLSDLAFGAEEEFFCDRQKRLARTRVARTKEILVARLADPPSLENLGREVGISAFYLSRTFSQETGMTIPQFLRRTRIERAAELIRAGTHNVSEAAFAVGYSSLGHFSKSFCEVMGVSPALYSQARNIEGQPTGKL
jgi:AraC-like DNA-binding protein